jgi:cell division protein ZapA
MSTVTLSIGPKSYAVVCADGQEAHIKALGVMIAEKYAQLGSARAPLEAQNLLFSALFLADELADLRKRAGPAPAPAPAPSSSSELDALRETVAALERELADARNAAAAAASNVPADDAAAEALAERLEALAAQAEASAAALEAGAGNA